jgi:hypothetical protein
VIKLDTNERPMPASPDTERSILGAILLDNQAYSEAALQLKPDDFSLDSHRRIYSRMADLANSSRPIDMITLVEELSRRKELEAIGDVGYVSGLVDGVPDRPSIEHYVRIVAEKASLRKIILACGATIEQALDGSESGEQILAANEVAMRRIAARHIATNSPRIRDWSQIPTLAQLPKVEMKWIVEGIIPAGSIVLWAGESGSYKTWLSLWLAKTVLEGGNFVGRKTVRLPVLYLDRENPLPLILQRCCVLGIASSESFKIWGGWQTDPPPMIGDARLLDIARTTKPLIVLDSFIRFHAADENSATEMGRVMAEVRALANAGAAVVLQHHKPKAEGTQYRGSSDIKAGVDVAFAVIREKEPKTLTFQCFKNRFGEEPTITVKSLLEDGGGFEVTQDQALQREQEEEQMLWKIIEGQPGVNQSEIVEMGVLPVNKTRSTLKRGEGRLWQTELGPRGSLHYVPIRHDSSSSALRS